MQMIKVYFKVIVSRKVDVQNRLLAILGPGPSEQSLNPQLLLGGDSSQGYFKQSMLVKSKFVSEVSN